MSLMTCAVEFPLKLASVWNKVSTFLLSKRMLMPDVLRFV